jgi:hypothetical protein
MRMVLILKEAGLPTKTSWEKGKGEPAPDSTTEGNMQLSREMRWAATGRYEPPSVAFDGGFNAYTEAAIIDEGQ